MSLKVFDLKCPLCGMTWEDAIVDPSDLPDCPDCKKGRMAKLPSATRVFAFTAGRSAESREQYNRNRRAMLEKRSADFDKTPRGRAEIEASIHRLKKSGHIP